MLFFAERKASKELQASGLTVCAGRKCIPSAPDTCLHSVNSCNPRRNTPNGQRVQSGSLTPAGAGFQWQMLSARRMLACRAKREQTTVGSRGYALPSRRMRVRDSVSVSLLVLFSSVRKAHIFSFGKERTHAFLCRKKSIKRTASLRLDRLCGPKMYSVGSRHVFALGKLVQSTAEHAERAASAIR